MADIVLYDLVGADDRRFSTHCWRVRPAMAHKGLSFETVPVIVDDGTWVHDSWTIAEYLEETYPDAPSLFGGAGGRALTGFVRHWW